MVDQTGSVAEAMAAGWKTVLATSHACRTREQCAAVVERLCSFDGVPRLTQRDNEGLESDVTIEEALEAMDALGRDKSPGIDGIANVFYKDYRDDIAPVLLSLYKSAMAGGELLTSFVKAWWSHYERQKTRKMHLTTDQYRS